jgi:hypothetical protein
MMEQLTEYGSFNVGLSTQFTYPAAHDIDGNACSNPMTMLNSDTIPVADDNKNTQFFNSLKPKERERRESGGSIDRHYF